MIFKLPTAKVKEIKSKCKQDLRQKTISIRQLAHIIGVLSSTHLAILPVPLHYRGLQTKKIRSSPPPLIRVDDNVGGTSVMDLNWWIHNLDTSNGRPIH